MDFFVEDFGAIGDGKTLDTTAIQRTIDAAAMKGGGRVVFVKHKTYFSGSLLLRENVELYLSKGCVLLASSNYSDYAEEHTIDIISAGIVTETVLPRRAFIAGYQAHDARISGPGEINGNAEGFILKKGQYIHEMKSPDWGGEQYLERPFTVFLVDSESVTLSEFTLKDPAFWAIRLTGCDHSTITGIKIHTDLMVPNADGIDIDRCENIGITNCELITADDCISIKSCSETSIYGDTTNIVIQYCKMVSTSGAITIGTESTGDISNVFVSDCIVKSSHRGFAVRAREGGLISGIHFKDSKIETRAFSPSWWGHGEAIHVTAFAWNEPHLVGNANPERQLHGRVKNVQFENLHIDCEAGALLWAQEKGLIRNIELTHINMEIGRRSKWPSRIDLRPNDIIPIVERAHNAFEIMNCQNVLLSDCSVQWDSSRAEYRELVHQSESLDVKIINLVEKKSQ